MRQRGVEQLTPDQVKELEAKKEDYCRCCVDDSSLESEGRITRILVSKGWTVLRIWQHEFVTEPDIVGLYIDRITGAESN